MNIIYQLQLLWHIPIISGLLFQFLFTGDARVELKPSCMLQDSVRTQKRAHAATANILFRSTDGGQTWQDISKGLPGNLEQAGFLANESGLYLQAGNEIYHGNPNSTLPSWKKEISLFPGRQGSIAPAKAGIVAYNFDGQFLQQVKGTGVWQPAFTNFQGREVRTVFETAAGTLFIGANNQLYKSTNGGKSWKTIPAGGMVMQMAESAGVLLATGAQGILRSTDDGENWNWVIREGGVGIAVERVKGGFAAITYNAQSRTRRVRTSYDGGNTWQPIDAGLQPQARNESIWQPIRASMPSQGTADSVWRTGNDLPAVELISSVIQVGDNFFCGHPNGIFRSSDKGRSWKLVLPSVDDKVFNLYVSGNVIYAVPMNGGC
jgi:photosystem II stability/assembly factor-like uncharacterized protein